MGVAEIVDSAHLKGCPYTTDGGVVVAVVLVGVRNVGCDDRKVTHRDMGTCFRRPGQQERRVKGQGSA